MKHSFCAALFVISVLLQSSGAQVASHTPSLPGAKAVAATAATSAPPSSKNLNMTPVQQPTGKPVAKVNGAVLSDRDLLREMYAIFPYAQQHNGFPKDAEPEIRNGALQMIIFEELVYQEAKRRNMSIPADKLARAEKTFKAQFPSDAAYQDFLKKEANGSEAALNEKIRRAMLIEELLNEEVNGPARVSDAQAKAHYEKHLDQYKHGEVVHLQSISIIPPNQTPAVLREAKQRAEDAAKQAKQAKNYRDFGLVAEKLSDDDYRVNMGDRKPQDLNAYPPPVSAALCKMKPGDVSDLIVMGDAYTIVRLESRTPAGTASFNEVKAQLEKELQQQKTQQLRSALNQKLRKNATIETM